MRYFRICTIILFVASLIFTGWTNYWYYSNLNTDSPTLSNSVGTLELSVTDPPEAIYRGLTAADATDGDLTDQIMVASVSHFLEPGLVKVKYVVFDSHNNAATLSRRVHYTDYQGPRFTMEKAPVYNVGTSFDLLDHIQVTDCLDGDISDRVRIIANMVNNYSEGTYPVILEVSNSCGDTAQLTLWVHYQRKASNVAIQLHQYIVYQEQDTEFDPYQYIASVADINLNPLDPKDVEIRGILDMETPGTYQLVYSYEQGNLTGKSAITVIVTERQA